MTISVLEEIAIFRRAVSVSFAFLLPTRWQINAESSDDCQGHQDMIIL